MKLKNVRAPSVPSDARLGFTVVDDRRFNAKYTPYRFMFSASTRPGIEFLTDWSRGIWKNLSPKPANLNGWKYGLEGAEGVFVTAKNIWGKRLSVGLENHTSELYLRPESFYNPAFLLMYPDVLEWIKGYTAIYNWERIRDKALEIYA